MGIFQASGEAKVTDQFYRDLIERAGGVYVGIWGGSVRFRAEDKGPLVSLYLTACRSREDVELALKAQREELLAR